MSFVNFLFGKFKADDPLRKVANVKQANRIANILNDITGEGCHIDKPTNAEGLGWRVIVPPYVDVIADILDDLIVEVIETIIESPGDNIEIIEKISDLIRTIIMPGWSDLTTTPVKVLGMDAEGDIGWVSPQDTQIDLMPELRVHDTGNGFEVQVRAKKVKLATAAGAISLAAGDYGAWSGVGACPEPE